MLRSKIEFGRVTLPETNIAHENHIFPGKYHQNCGFSMAMLVSGSVSHYLREVFVHHKWYKDIVLILSNLMK